MIQLYSMAYQDRSDRVRWLLEELQVPFENKFLKKSLGEMSTPEYLSLNPMGRVPTIVDGSQVVFESGAITLYLADKYGLKKLAPALDSDLRPAYLQWMVFSVGSLECVVAKMFDFKGRSEDEIQKMKSEVAKQCEILVKPILKSLEKHEFILPSGFSAADIMLGSIIPGAADYLMNYDLVKKYIETLQKRPAAIKAQVFG